MVEIGLNGLLLDSPHSGTAVYTRNLVPNISVAAPDLQFLLFTRNASFVPGDVRWQRLVTPLHRFNRSSGPVARLDKLAWETVSLPLAAWKQGLALIHSLYFAAPFVSPVPVVVTVHDLVPLTLPGYHRSRQSALYSMTMARAVRRAAAIITVSEHSKRDICRVLGVPAERVTVTYEAADDLFSYVPSDAQLAGVRQQYALPERFVLYTGGAERRKNLEVLVRAWKEARDTMRRHECALVIVADFPQPDALYPDVPGLIAHLGLEQDVRIVPRVSQPDMPALYRCALAFCFPSMYEGFGLTPLEAMTSGVPVIASSATSIPEVVGDAAWLVPPDDISQWAEALSQVVISDSDRAALAQRGERRARDFSWKKCAEETVQVYRTVLNR